MFALDNRWCEEIRRRVRGISRTGHFIGGPAWAHPQGLSGIEGPPTGRKDVKAVNPTCTAGRRFDRRGGQIRSSSPSTSTSGCLESGRRSVVQRLHEPPPWVAYQSTSIRRRSTVNDVAFASGSRFHTDLRRHTRIRLIALAISKKYKDDFGISTSLHQPLASSGLRDCDPFSQLHRCDLKGIVISRRSGLAPVHVREDWTVVSRHPLVEPNG